MSANKDSGRAQSKPKIQKKTENWIRYVDVDDDTNITANDAALILEKARINTFELPAEKKYE